jgi:hypothetical protein
VATRAACLPGLSLTLALWTLRSLSRNDAALQMQLALEETADAAGKPDEYVFEELEALYRAEGDLSRAQHYADRKTAARQR